MPDSGTDAWLGRRVHHYRAVQRVSTGPTFGVYRATTELADGFYALKIYPLGAPPHDEARIRAFLDAARERTRSRHPALLSAIEAGQEPECLWIAFEWVDAGRAPERVLSGRAMAAEAVVRWTRGVTEALAHLEAQGLPHRSLHPGNILIDVQGNARLADVGLGRLLLPGVPRDGGDPPVEPARYLAPEERAGREPDARANLYSLGTVLWFFLAGREPHATLSRERLLEPGFAAPPPGEPDIPGGTPPYLTETLRELLQEDPRRRPADAATVARWLQIRRVERLAATPPLARPTSGGTPEPGPAAAPETPASEAAEALASGGSVARAPEPSSPGRRTPVPGTVPAAPATPVTPAAAPVESGPARAAAPPSAIPAPPAAEAAPAIPPRRPSTARTPMPPPIAAAPPAAVPSPATPRHPTPAPIPTPPPPPARPARTPIAPLPPLPDGSRRLPSLLEQGRLPLPIVLDIVQECLADLAKVHAEGRIHGDLHPGRIALDPRGSARLVEYGEQVSDPRLPYAAPERLLGAQQIPDVAADLYSLAVVFYELATGGPPYPGECEEEVRASMQAGEPVAARERDAGLSVDLEAVLAKSLSRSRDRRYRDAEAFRVEVLALKEGRATRARAERPPVLRWLERARRRIRRFGWVGAGAGAVALSLAAGSALMDLREERRRDERVDAQREERLRADKAAERLLADARALAQAGEWGLADRLAERILAERPESRLADETRIFLGESASRTGDVERALDRLGEVYGRDPASPAGRRALLGMGEALLRARRLAAARAACDRVVADSPDGAEVRRAELRLADLLVAEHRFDQAARLFEELARPRKDTPESVTAEIAREATESRRWLRLLGLPRRHAAPGLRILAAGPAAPGTAPAWLVAARPNEISVHDSLGDPPAPRSRYTAPPGDAFPVAAARAIDLNGDGAAEIIAATTGITVFREERGTLIPVAVERLGSRILPAALAAGDADNDGRPDLVVGLASPDRRCLFYRVGSDFRLELAGGFSLPDRPSGEVTGVAVGDWTGDGRNEVAVAFARVPGAPDAELRLIQFAVGYEEPRTLWKFRLGEVFFAGGGDVNGDHRAELLVAGAPPRTFPAAGTRLERTPFFPHRAASPVPGGLLLAYGWRDDRFHTAAALVAGWDPDLIAPSGAPILATDLDGDGQPELSALWGIRQGPLLLVTHQLAWWDGSRWVGRTLVLEEIDEAEFRPGAAAVDLDGNGRAEFVLSTGRHWWVIGGGTP